MWINPIIWLRRNYKMIKWCEPSNAKRHCINLNYCNSPDKNIGDLLSPIVYNYMLSLNNITPPSNGKTDYTYHIYAIGSILTMGYQDAIVWGSGILSGDAVIELYKGRLYGRKLDIRAVRGPLTRKALCNAGYACPVVYGDPAIMMTDIYRPLYATKKYKISVLIHFDKIPDEYAEMDVHFISVKTDDYKFVIDEIAASEKIISSSLHGLILSEIYEVPVVMILDDVMEQVTKFYDWFLSTGRKEFCIASSLRQAINMKPTELPDPLIIKEMKEKLISVFPYEIFGGMRK